MSGSHINKDIHVSVIKGYTNLIQNEIVTQPTHGAKSITSTIEHAFLICSLTSSLQKFSTNNIKFSNNHDLQI